MAKKKVAVEAPSPVLQRRIPTELDARKVAAEHLLGPLKMQMPKGGQEDLVVVEAPSPVLKRRIPTELIARNVATEVKTKDRKSNRHLMHPFLCPTMLSQSLEAFL
jgi:hypothetical protein